MKRRDFLGLTTMTAAMLVGEPPEVYASITQSVSNNLLPAIRLSAEIDLTNGINTSEATTTVTLENIDSGRYVIIEPYSLNAELAQINTSGNIASINSLFEHSHPVDARVDLLHGVLWSDFFGISENRSPTENNSSIEKLLTACAQTGMDVRFSAGKIKVNQTIRLYGLSTISIRGNEGHQGFIGKDHTPTNANHGNPDHPDYIRPPWNNLSTIFQWVGNSNDPMFLIEDCRAIRFGGFRILIETLDRLHTAILMQRHYSPLTIQGIRFEDIHIEPKAPGLLKFGVHITHRPNRDLNNDFHEFNRVVVRDARNAFCCTATQAKGLIFRNCFSKGSETGATQYGWYMDAGGFTLESCGCNNSSKYDIFTGFRLDSSEIRFFNSEHSSAFLHANGPTKAMTPITISGVRWRRAYGEDGQNQALNENIILVQNAGGGTIRDSKFIGDQSGEIMRAKLDLGPTFSQVGHAQLLSDNVAWHTNNKDNYTGHATIIARNQQHFDTTPLITEETRFNRQPDFERVNGELVGTLYPSDLEQGDGNPLMTVPSALGSTSPIVWSLPQDSDNSILGWMRIPDNYSNEFLRVKVRWATHSTEPPFSGTTVT